MRPPGSACQQRMNGLQSDGGKGGALGETPLLSPIVIGGALYYQCGVKLLSTERLTTTEGDVCSGVKVSRDFTVIEKQTTRI